MKISVPYRREDRVSAPEWGCFALDGEIGRRTDLYNARGVKSVRAREKVFAEARSFFRDQPDDALRVGYWRGEFWGKLMLSAVRVCRMTGDAEFKEFIRMVDEKDYATAAERLKQSVIVSELMQEARLQAGIFFDNDREIGILTK